MNKADIEYIAQYEEELQSKLQKASDVIYKAILDATGTDDAVIMIDFVTPKTMPYHLLIRREDNVVSLADILMVFSNLIDERSAAIAKIRAREGVTLQ